MTTATTRASIRAELYGQVPGLGFTAVADSLSATTLTDTGNFQDSTLNANQYRGAYIYRPSLTGDDMVKRATSLNRTTGVLTHGGSNWSNTSTQPYELVGAMHPDELNACIQRALRRMYYEQLKPLCGELENYDGDMQATGVTNWTSVGTPATKEKTATVTTTAFGTNSLHVLNDATNEGVQSATMRSYPTQNEEVFVSTAVRANVGTATLQLWDVTNSVVISSVTSAEEGFVRLWLVDQVPAGCEEFAIRLIGAENNADLYWNHCIVYRRNHTIITAPSALDEPFKMLKLREAVYSAPISSQAKGGYDDAYSRYFKDWLTPSMYSLDPLHTDTNAYRIQLMRMIPQAEMWIDMKRPWSDYNSLDEDTDSTYAPLNQLYAYAKQEIGQTMRKRSPGNKAWEVLLAEADRQVDAETVSRPEIPMQPIKREYLGRI